MAVHCSVTLYFRKAFDQIYKTAGFPVLVIRGSDSQPGQKVLGFYIWVSVLGGCFLVFIRRFSGFLFFMPLLNAYKIRLIEMTLGFLRWCNVLVQIYLRICLNHGKYVSKSFFFRKPSKLGRIKLVTPPPYNLLEIPSLL